MDEYMTLSEVSRFLRMGKTTINRLALSGRIHL